MPVPMSADSTAPPSSQSLTDYIRVQLTLSMASYHRDQVLLPSMLSSSPDCETSSLPLAVTPMFLTARLLQANLITLAAYVHWTVVLARPSCPEILLDAAIITLKKHFHEHQWPFYLVSNKGLMEKETGTWGWKHWHLLCDKANQNQ